MIPEIKICGVTNVEDALAALAMGADYLGFVMYAKSPRGISAERLRRVRDALPDEARCIAVFVNESRDVVLRVAEECRLYAVQIHGDESTDDFRAMPLPVWRALAVSAQGIKPLPVEWPADRYVVDAPAPGRYGGSGELADWGRRQMKTRPDIHGFRKRVIRLTNIDDYTDRLISGNPTE